MLATAVVTRSEYENMPDGPPFHQLIEGQLVMSPSPSTNHQRVVLRLSSILHDFVSKERLGEIFVAPIDVFLTETNIYQPDIVFVSKERARRIGSRGIEGAPDLCVEVLSPASEHLDRVIKKKIFAQCGVREYWLANAAEKSVTIYDLLSSGDEPAARRTSPGKITSPILPNLEIDLRRLFAGCA